MANQLKTIIILCDLFVLILCPFLIFIAIRGEKRMIRDKYIKASLGWPEVCGERVPIVARRYKLLIITFSCVIFIFSICGSIYLLTKR